MRNGAVGVTEKSVRQTVTLPIKIAKRVRTIAKSRRLSANRVLVELVEEGIEARERREREFFALTERLRSATDLKRLSASEMNWDGWCSGVMPRLETWGRFPLSLRRHLMDRMRARGYIRGSFSFVDRLRKDELYNGRIRGFCPARRLSRGLSTPRATTP